MMNKLIPAELVHIKTNSNEIVNIVIYPLSRDSKHYSIFIMQSK